MAYPYDNSDYDAQQVEGPGLTLPRPMLPFAGGMAAKPAPAQAPRPQPQPPPRPQAPARPGAAPVDSRLLLPRKSRVEHRVMEEILKLRAEGVRVYDPGDLVSRLHFGVLKTSAVNAAKPIIAGGRLALVSLSKQAMGGTGSTPPPDQKDCVETTFRYQDDGEYTRVLGPLVLGGMSIRYAFENIPAITATVLKQFEEQAILRFWRNGEKLGREIRLYEVPTVLDKFRVDGARRGTDDMDDALWFERPIVMRPDETLALTVEQIPDAVQDAANADLSNDGAVPPVAVTNRSVLFSVHFHASAQLIPV